MKHLKLGPVHSCFDSECMATMTAFTCQGCHTKYYRLSGFNQRDLFPPVGKLKSRITVLAGLVFPKASPLSLQLAAFSLCHHRAVSFCEHLFYSFYRDISPTGLGLHPAFTIKTTRQDTELN